MLKKLWRALAPNPLERLLRHAQRAKAKRILLVWNRGLGDIALGLYAIVQKIRDFLPEASVTFLTRSNLAEGFSLLSGVEVLIAPGLQRGEQISAVSLLQEIGHAEEEFDLIIEKPDPTYWVRSQLGKVTPLLSWSSEKDDLWRQYSLKEGKHYIGVHVHTETNYGSRDWPEAHWRELFERLSIRGQEILLFGFAKNPAFSLPNVRDLRGETTLFSLLSLIKHSCHTLIVPDSGISAMTYFLNEQFPIVFISLWGNPNMGILKQNVASPNLLLKHIPLIGEKQSISSISPKLVESVVMHRA